MTKESFNAAKAQLIKSGWEFVCTSMTGDLNNCGSLYMKGKRQFRLNSRTIDFVSLVTE
jgi:hypothetical protein